MINAWQHCQGDYCPEPLFIRGNKTVIAKNISEVEDGLYQWEEYAMLTEDYENVIASTSVLSDQTNQNTANIEYIAVMSDIEL